MTPFIYLIVCMQRKQVNKFALFCVRLLGENETLSPLIPFIISTKRPINNNII